MQPPATESPTRDAPDFAGLLSALTAPARKRDPAWNDQDLAQDVATLSYESALRAHARYRQEDHALDRVDLVDAAPSHPAARIPAALTRAFEKDRKSASITIRMSRTECEQLHRRAAEAGLTVSAYLRSCTLEAEALRAQVKQALAEMKKAGTEGPGDKGNEETKRQPGGETSERENRSQIDRDSEAPRQSTAKSKLDRVMWPIQRLGIRFSRRRCS